MKKIHNEVKHLPRVPDSRKSERGFSLIELLIAMAVVLVLVGGIAIAGERSLQASRETSALQSVQSFTSDVTTYQRSYGGFPTDVLYLQTAVPPAAGMWQADNELSNQLATTLNGNTVSGGTANGGYWLFYDANTANSFGGSSGATSVNSTYEITANPTDQKTKSFCGDNTGVYYLVAPNVMSNAGNGCIVDNAGAFPIGQ